MQVPTPLSWQKTHDAAPESRSRGESGHSRPELARYVNVTEVSSSSQLVSFYFQLLPSLERCDNSLKFTAATQVALSNALALLKSIEPQPCTTEGTCKIRECHRGALILSTSLLLCPSFGVVTECENPDVSSHYPRWRDVVVFANW